ncbi:MAG: hypothetical protein CL700_00120 [Chloroflexi bacterium]|nr:hypothetical protein [Chloroflexota bacterium]
MAGKLRQNYLAKKLPIPMPAWKEPRNRERQNPLETGRQGINRSELRGPRINRVVLLQTMRESIPVDPATTNSNAPWTFSMARYLRVERSFWRDRMTMPDKVRGL